MSEVEMNKSLCKPSVESSNRTIKDARELEQRIFDFLEQENVTHRYSHFSIRTALEVVTKHFQYSHS